MVLIILFVLISLWYMYKTSSKHIATQSIVCFCVDACVYRVVS